MKNYAIILASGIGARSGLNIPKQYFKVSGKTVLQHTVERFINNKNIDALIIVINKEYTQFIEEMIKDVKTNKIIKIVEGGPTRQASSYNAISSIQEDECNVLIHDGARPFLDDIIINDCIQALNKHNAIDVIVDAADTIVLTNKDGFITDIPQRTFVKRGQTPQAFKKSLIKKCHEAALLANDNDSSCDCGLVHKYSKEKVFCINGNEYNIKITTPLDIEIANTVLRIKKSQATEANLDNLRDKNILKFGASRAVTHMSAKTIPRTRPQNQV